MVIRTIHDWPIRAGTVCALACVAATIGFDTYGYAADFELSSNIELRGPTLWVLRNAFLLIAIGVFWRLREFASRPWRPAVGVAVAMLAAGFIADTSGALLPRDWLINPAATFFPEPDIARRLLRLALMAAYAIPTLVLLAAARADYPPAAKTIVHSIPVSLLLRWEPMLFLVAAATLAPLLVAAAAFGPSIVWLLPIGADAAIAACVAAAIRARDRDDPCAFAGWLAVCASMGVGSLMGMYAFGGPLPAPAFIGAYESAVRTLLRDAHVVALILGIIAIANSVLRKQQEK